MKTKTVSAGLSLLLLASAILITQPSQAARLPALRYHFAEGQTNAYKVEIEVRGENGTDKLVGNLIVSPKAGPSNVLCLGVRGMLSPRREPGMMSPGFGMGGYPRGMTPVSLNNPAEIWLDDRGRVLRVTGDYPLPIPLGSVAQLFAETLPAASETRWESSDELAVLDDPPGLGPAISFLPAQPYGMSYFNGPYNPRGGVAVVTVTRKIRYEIKSSTADQATISKQLNLDSRLQSGAEPRIRASGDGEFVFDRQSGFIRSATMQFKNVLNGENITRRRSGSVRVSRLEGEERETALRPYAEHPARKLTSEEIQKIIEDLKSNDSATRTAAASKLQASELTEAPTALLELMTGLLTDSEMSVKMAAAKIIADYGTTEQVPALLKLLRSGDTSLRWSAIRGLGRLKDKRAAEPLAALLASGSSDGYQAVEALTKIGPDAEDAVLPLLKEKHVETRRQACSVLKQIGTQKSVEPLRELMLDPDQMLSTTAAEAVREILARQ
jgi:hypothetical protein